jgi:hypothetical protein
MHLNKKGYQPVFKGISREKRTHLAKKIDEGPPLAHYTPNYGVVMERSRTAEMRSEPEKNGKERDPQMLCGKMV